jgi:uncharacterized delta-60 repeat protein
MTSGSPPMFEPLEDRRMFSAGDLDPTFGSGGKVIAEKVGFPVAAVTVQNDGRVIAVGRLLNDFAVARLNPDGKLDQTFGDHGVARADFGGSRGDFASCVAVQPNGKIVVAGRRDNHSDFAFGDQGEFAVARFNTNGTLDTSFDGDGKASIDFKGYGPSEANAIAIQSDGRIVVVGDADTQGLVSGYNVDFAIARLMPNGSLDHTFGDSFFGVTRTGMTTIDHFGEFNPATAVSVAPDGKIVVAGPSDHLVMVRRLQPNGTTDTTFHGGEAILNFSPDPNINAGYPIIGDVSAQPDGSAFVVGSVDGNFLVTKLKDNGQSDTSFGGSGFVKADFGGNDVAHSVRVSREGILVAGGSDGKFAMTRLTQKGFFDGFFGSSGKVVTAVAPGESILSTSLTNDGRILAIGSKGDTARYISAEPKVGISTIDSSGREGGANDASFIVTRDKIYSFPTRVYFNLTGTATFGQDYSSSVLKLASRGNGVTTSRGTLGTIGTISGIGINPVTQTAYVDIPADQSFVVVPITILSDALTEPTETVSLSINANAHYKPVDATSQSATVTIADKLTISIPPGSIIIARSATSVAADIFGDARISGSV